MSSTPFGDLLKQAAEAKYVVVPANDYMVVVKDASAVKSSTGKDMIKLSVKILAGPFKGSGILTQQTLSPDNPAALNIFFRFLEAFGIDEEFLNGLPAREDGGPNIPAVAAALKGRAAVAAVDISQWNDEDRNGVSKFKKPNPEQVAAIKEAMGADGIGGPDPFSAPSAGPSDPFVAAASPAAGGATKDPF